MSEYSDGYPGLDEPLPRVYVKFQPEGSTTFHLALLDTGGHFCILSREVAALVGETLTQGLEEVSLMTARGRIRGEIFKHNIELIADSGENLAIEATVFISSDWTGPSVLGYTGVIDRAQIAAAPQNNGFYFGPMG